MTHTEMQNPTLHDELISLIENAETINEHDKMQYLEAIENDQLNDELLEEIRQALTYEAKNIDANITLFKEGIAEEKEHIKHLEEENQEAYNNIIGDAEQFTENILNTYHHEIDAIESDYYSDMEDVIRTSSEGLRIKEIQDNMQEEE